MNPRQVLGQIQAQLFVQNGQVCPNCRQFNAKVSQICALIDDCTYWGNLCLSFWFCFFVFSNFDVAIIICTSTLAYGIVIILYVFEVLWIRLTRNFSDQIGNNNHMFCWACQNHYCYLCKKIVRRGSHHYGPKGCKQHTEG